MKTFNITVHTGTEEFQLEAEDKDEASDMAWQTICDDYGKDLANDSTYIVEEEV